MKAKASIRSKPGRVFVDLFQTLTSPGSKSRAGKANRASKPSRAGKASRAAFPERVRIFFGSFRAPRLPKRFKTTALGRFFSEGKW